MKHRYLTGKTNQHGTLTRFANAAWIDSAGKLTTARVSVARGEGLNVDPGEEPRAMVCFQSTPHPGDRYMAVPFSEDQLWEFATDLLTIAAEMERDRLAAEDEADEEPEPDPLRVGDVVTIKEGTYAGHRAVIRSVASNGTIQAQLVNRMIPDTAWRTLDPDAIERFRVEPGTQVRITVGGMAGQCGMVRYAKDGEAGAYVLDVGGSPMLFHASEFEVASAEPQPRFRRGDIVRITEGFYKGQSAEVVGYHEKPGTYNVVPEGSLPTNILAFPESWLVMVRPGERE